jgi:hypothetical protein
VVFAGECEGPGGRREVSGRRAGEGRGEEREGKGEDSRSSLTIKRAAGNYISLWTL